MANNEEKINKFLDFPYDAFLMVRLEYVQILGDELEAKLLRIIEKYIDMERKRIYREMINAAPANNGQVVEVSKDIWVPISYRLFMNDLFGTVTSENTVKKALKDMIKKKIIFQRFQPKKKYDAPEYKIHVNPLQTLLSMLPNPGYQKLIPSYIDTLKDLPPQELTPSECQELIPLAALRVSKIDTNITEVTNNNREVITEESNSDDTTKHTSVSSDTARAASLQDEEMFTDEEQRDTLRVLQEAGLVPFETPPQGDDHAHCVPPLPAANTPTPGERTTSRPGSDHSHRRSRPADGLPVVRSVGSGTPGPQGSRDEKDTSPLTPAQSLSLPQAEQAASGTQGKTKKAKPESLAPKCDTKEIQRRINENRGYGLEEDVEIIRERKAIKTWCNLHTLEDFAPVMKYLTTVDLYWRKPENRNRIGGLTLLKETSRVKSELEKLESRRKSPNGNITLLPSNGRDLAARSRALREQYAGVRS